MTDFEMFVKMLEDQDVSRGGFSKLKGKCAIHQVKAKQPDENKNCWVVDIRDFDVEFVFWDGKFMGIIKK